MTLANLSILVGSFFAYLLILTVLVLCAVMFLPFAPLILFRKQM
jgi:hypothetical protein